MSNTMNFLKELAEAQQAVEQVPILRDEVRAKHEENLRLDRQRSDLIYKLENRESEIDKLKAQITELRAERDDASFREMATADKLDALQSKIGALVDLAQELKPTPEPEVVSEALPPGEPVTDMISTYTPEQPPVAYATERLDQRVDETISHPVPKYENQGLTPGNDYRTDEPSTIDPSLGFMKPTSPYANLQYWQKPYHVSTDDFVSGGGEAPSWYVNPIDHEQTR